MFPNTTVETVLNSTISASRGSTAFGLIIELVCLWTIVGNLVIILVLTLYKPLTIPDILVFSLALSDFLNVLFPVQVLNIIPNLLHTTWTERLCIAFTWTTYWFRVSSVLTITVISLDRLLAVHKPLVYRSRVMHEVLKVKILICTLWFVSFLLATLPFIGFGHSGYHNGKCDYQLIHLGLGYGILMEVIGWLQLVVVLYCYIAIKVSTGNFMKRQRKFRKAHVRKRVSFKDDETNRNNTDCSRQNSVSTLSVASSTDDERRLRPVHSWRRKPLKWKGRADDNASWTDGMRQVAKMERLMATLVFLFYLSWLPFLVSNLVSLATGKTDETVIRIVGICSLINAVVNPVIYATVYPRYKKGYLFVFKTVLSLCGGRKPDITTADFDISKRNRSKRLETLREVLSTSSLSTEDTSYTKRLQSWSYSTSLHAAMIPEEEGNETMGNTNRAADLNEGNNADNVVCGDLSAPSNDMDTTCKQIDQDVTLPGESSPSRKFDSARQESRDNSVLENGQKTCISNIGASDVTYTNNKCHINKEEVVLLGNANDNKVFQEF